MTAGQSPIGQHHLGTMFDAGRGQADSGFIRTVLVQVGRQQHREDEQDEFLSGAECVGKPFGSYRRSSVTAQALTRLSADFCLLIITDALYQAFLLTTWAR